MTNLENDLKVVLHLGAHKTASTHLQRSLLAAGDDLSRAGVRVYGPPTLRVTGATLAERFGFPFDPRRARADTDPLKELADMAGDGHRIVFSEENFAGNFHRGWGKVPVPLYPDAPARLTKLSNALGRPLHICVAVRQPCDYLSSLYSQILLAGKEVMPDEFLQRNAPAQVDWADYIERLRGTSGVADVTVWQYEDYVPVFKQVVSTMVGPDAACLVIAHHGRSMPRMSQAAVGAVVAQRLVGGTRKDMKQIVAEHPVTDDNPRFSLFEQAHHAVATQRYVAQISAIAAMANVTVLRP